MANEYTAFGSALHSYLNAQATVDVYYVRALQNTAPEYCIVQRQSGLLNYTFTSRGMNTDYLVKVVSNRMYPGVAWQVYEHIAEAMQDAPLNITGFTLLRCRQSSSIEFPDNDGFWHVGHLYDIDAQEN